MLLASGLRKFLEYIVKVNPLHNLPSIRNCVHFIYPEIDCRYFTMPYVALYSSFQRLVVSCLRSCQNRDVLSQQHHTETLVKIAEIHKVFRKCKRDMYSGTWSVFTISQPSCNFPNNQTVAGARCSVRLEILTFTLWRTTSLGSAWSVRNSLHLLAGIFQVVLPRRLPAQRS